MTCPKYQITHTKNKFTTINFCEKLHNYRLDCVTLGCDGHINTWLMCERVRFLWVFQSVSIHNNVVDVSIRSMTFQCTASHVVRERLFSNSMLNNKMVRLVSQIRVAFFLPFQLVLIEIFGLNCTVFSQSRNSFQNKDRTENSRRLYRLLRSLVEISFFSL